MMRKLARVVVYVLAFLAVPLGIGALGFRSGIRAYLAPTPVHALGSDLPAPPELDPLKPTVAVVLGKTVTEVADTIAPYVAFKTAGVFNVVLVAEGHGPVALSGGLDVVPHFTFADLDARLGRDPDLIVIPNIVDVRANEAVRSWVRRHGAGRSLVMSVCAGAEMFAATGLIDGRRATTHWGDIGRIEAGYPAVQWVRGQRYIDDGQFISTAGILSGIDGSLHMIDRLKGRALALQVSRALHYDGARFLDDPAMVQFRRAPRDAILLFNLAYGWDRPSLGVPLHDGMDDLRLAAVYDTYGLSFTLSSVAPRGVIVTTRHGLRLVARRSAEDWSASGGTLLPDRPDPARFPFDAALEDVARRQDVPTAEFAAKRLEYRAVPPLQGRGWWRTSTAHRPVLLGMSGLLVAFGISAGKRARRRSR